MELPTQEILIHLNRIDEKINKLQDDIKEIKKQPTHAYIDPLPRINTTVPRLSPNSRQKRSLRRTDTNALYFDSINVENAKSDLRITNLELNAIELRPSRLLLDQLSLLNESRTYLHPKMQLSYYHTNFAIIDRTFLPYNGIFLKESIVDINHKFYSLPFLIADEPIFDSDFTSTLLIMDQVQWYENVHAYILTHDLMVHQVKSIQATLNNDVQEPYYFINIHLEPITVTLDEFIQLGADKSIPILNIYCNSEALNKDSHEQTLLMLLLRALLYSKAKDYLLDIQQEISKDSTMMEMTKQLTRLEQSTISINGIKLSTEKFKLSLQEMSVVNNDIGDDTFALSLRQFFGKWMTYESGNKLDPNRIVHILSQQYETARIPINVTMITSMHEKQRQMQTFGLLISEFDLSKGQNVFYLTSPELQEKVGSYQNVLETAQVFEPKYTYPFPVISVKDDSGFNNTYTADKLLYSDKRKDFSFSYGKPITITDAILSAGFYTLPAGSISRFVDIFFTYPQMLPYSTELIDKYRVSMIREETIRADGNQFLGYEGIIGAEEFHNGVFTMVTLDIGNGLTISALKLRITLEQNKEQILAIRNHHYYNKYAKKLECISPEELDKFLRQTTLIEYSWDFYTYDGKPWDRDVKMNAYFRGLNAVSIPILAVPDGFITWTQQYDLEYQQTVNIISALVYRSSVHETEISELKKILGDVTSIINHLVSAVNAIETAFTKLTTQLQQNSTVPWWKKVLQGLVMVAGLAGSIVFPFSLPLAIGLIAGSTVIQVGLMFADGDYLAGGIQLAGALIGLGIGYYGFRKASASAYPVVNLEEARVLPIDKDIPGITEMETDGMWIEVKPLNIINNKMEDVGKFMIKNTKGLLRTLMKFDNAPVHARVRSQTTKLVKGKVMRTTIVTGVTDGMPYLSHVNPRPGIFELLEVYDGEKFVNGWTKDNVPIGGNFEDLGKSYQGLLIEGVGTDGEFKTLMSSWSRMSPDERAITMNDAQDYIRKTQTMYTTLSHSKVPISFDESLVRNVSNVFAKHTGIYELIGLGAPAGPNNCQTYSKELRDFFAKGVLRKNKLNNTTFLNDLMDAFDHSVQFSHIYKPAFEKRPTINRNLVPVQIASF